MYFPLAGSKIPEEQKQIDFSWDQFIPGMQPSINYRFYFRITGNGITFERHLLKANSITVDINDLAGFLGLQEGSQYNWEVRAVQHSEGDDRLYFGTVNNLYPQNGTRVQVVSSGVYFNIVPKASTNIVPFVVPEGDPLFGSEPIKPRDTIPSQRTPEEIAGSVIPGTVPGGTQPTIAPPGSTLSLPEEEEETNYTPILIGAAALIAIFYFAD